ncbi:Hypothetical predicted protein [Mytilus galloprovincialis]|uniref:Band 7 domain-containing protein n=1 Tax=Mytilus galloprovincialis TaxID=29158 RepID=A0A8B6CVR7_MYTGA|nr:Hypothetical predicted protein [Mytilus galloprovincialis]
MDGNRVKHSDNSQGDDGGIGCCGCILMGLSYVLVVLFFPFSLCMTIKAEMTDLSFIYTLLKGPPNRLANMNVLYITLFLNEFKTRSSSKPWSYDVPPQENVESADYTIVDIHNKNLIISVYFRFFDLQCLCVTWKRRTVLQRLLAQYTRNVLGTKNMSEILTDRDSIAAQMQHILDESTDPWGIKVERVEIKDVRLPVQLQRAMAAEAEASREARAKVLAAEGEQRASRALKEAADIMAQSPAAIQLRYLQTLNSIAAERNSTIIFPLPMDLIKGFAK